MAFFSQPLSGFCTHVKTGLTVIGVFALVRFLMLPAFGVPYDQGTTYTSVFIVSLIVIVLYAIGHARDAGGYKDLLAISFIVLMTANLFIVVAIGIDEGLGIDTYYTDPAHGGSQNVFLHMFGHLVPATIIGSLFGWLVASIVYTVAKPVFGSR